MVETTYRIWNGDGELYSETYSPETAEAASKAGLKVTAETR